MEDIHANPRSLDPTSLRRRGENHERLPASLVSRDGSRKSTKEGEGAKLIMEGNVKF